MTRLRERSQIRAVVCSPAAERNDVINVRRRLATPTPAERFLTQHPLTDPLPPRSVSTLDGARATETVGTLFFPSMLRAEALVREGRAPTTAARLGGATGHHKSVSPS